MVCKSKLHPFLEDLPKCEHHVHVKDTLTPEQLFALAAKNPISLRANYPAFVVARNSIRCS